MNVPTDLKYTDTHEWARLEARRHGERRHHPSCAGAARRSGVCGNPEVGKQFQKGQECGVVESVKAASDIYAPVSGEVVAVNEALGGPQKINQDAYAAWMFKLKPERRRGARLAARCGGVPSGC